MTELRRVAAALIHYPVVDRRGETVTAAITNIDVHDLSRSAYTYGLCALYLVHPIAAQRELAARIRAHWVHGSGAKRIPDRKPPLEQLMVVCDLEAALQHLSGDDGDVELWTTSARPASNALTHDEARERLATPGPPVLLAFGTSWGLASSVHERASCHLAPIESPRSDSYNHLSVRAAAAILFDRLVGVRGGTE